jgi:hypothetical protein
MPKMDGTGPEGKGPMTGRGMGKCSDGNQNTERGGFGRGGNGRACGRRRCFNNPSFQNGQK